MMRPHLRVAAAAVLATSSMLAACGGGGGGGSGGPVTVSGTVVDLSGVPLGGANVVLDADTANLVTTGADGAFTFAKVTQPYSLTVKSGTSIEEYHALKRSNPQIVFGGSGLRRSANLSGSVTGPTLPLPTGQRIVLGGTNGVLTTGSPSSTSGAFSTKTFLWTGTSSVTTDLAALRVAATGSLITGYLQLGKRTGVSLQDGVSQSGLDIALDTAVTTETTVLNYAPGAYSDSRANYLMLRAGGAQFFIGSGSSIPIGAKVLLPDGGGTFLIRGQDASGNLAARIGMAVLGGTTTLDLPSSTVLSNSLPADATTGVSTTPVLSWTPVSSADLYVVSLSGPGLNYTFYLPSGTSALTVPDYSALTLPLAGSTAYTWSVRALTLSRTSPDALTDPAVGGFSEFTLVQATDLALYDSQSFGFTTAP
jgi:hypothetical protein